MVEQLIKLVQHRYYVKDKSSVTVVYFCRLQFRKLIRMYECDLCFTPMIMADSYVKSAKARAHEFQTDKGLIKNLLNLYQLNKIIFLFNR